MSVLSCLLLCCRRRIAEKGSSPEPDLRAVSMTNLPGGGGGGGGGGEGEEEEEVEAEEGKERRRCLVIQAEMSVRQASILAEIPEIGRAHV